MWLAPRPLVPGISGGEATAVDIARRDAWAAATGAPQPPLCAAPSQEALPGRLRPLVRRLDVRHAVESFVARHPPQPRIVRLARQAARLGGVVPALSATALFGTYKMQVLTTDCARRLLHPLPDAPLKSMLDVGSGDGSVARPLSPLFEDIACTDVSLLAVLRARRRGFRAVRTDTPRHPYLDPPGGDGRFSVVCLFNVLDRATHPGRLLSDAWGRLAPGGSMLVSLALPLRAFVTRVGGSVRPSQELLGASAEGPGGWEQGAAELVPWLEARLCGGGGQGEGGGCVRAVARVPYLCQGDDLAPLYWLDAAIVRLDKT